MGGRIPRELTVLRIVRRTGIKERRISREAGTSALGIEASRTALELAPGKIELIGKGLLHDPHAPGLERSNGCKQLKAVEHGFALVGEGILFAAHALENLLNLASGNPPEWLRKLLGFGGQAFDGATGGGGRAPAHATGGLVGRPAPGEFFASVAPGEMILPERIVRSLMSNQRAALR